MIEGNVSQIQASTSAQSKELEARIRDLEEKAKKQEEVIKRGETATKAHKDSEMRLRLELERLRKQSLEATKADPLIKTIDTNEVLNKT